MAPECGCHTAYCGVTRRNLWPRRTLVVGLTAYNFYSTGTQDVYELWHSHGELPGWVQAACVLVVVYTAMRLWWL